MGDRSESLQSPRGAPRIPLLVILMVLVGVLIVLIVGLTRWWLVFLILPALLLTAFILARVAASFRPSKKSE